MNIVIFEDDADDANCLKNIISQYEADFSVSLITGDFEGLIRHIALLEKPTIFMIDIMFGDRADGFKMADAIISSRLNAIVVFITNYPDKILANSFYKMRAFNVILKQSVDFEHEVRLTLKEAAKYVKDNHILLYRDKFVTILITIEGIYYIETVANKNKIQIHHQNGMYFIKTSLAKFIKQLPEHFRRCHHSYIVNTKQITSINHANCAINMSNGGTCYYSARNKAGLLKALNGRAAGVLER